MANKILLVLNFCNLKKNYLPRNLEGRMRLIEKGENKKLQKFQKIQKY